MTSISRRALFLLFAAYAARSADRAFGADEYPSQPVKILMPGSAGSAADVSARMLADALAQKLGQVFYVENRDGAGGLLAGAEVIRAPPDGYTLLYTTVAGHGISPNLYENVPYDPEQDFAPISLVSQVPNIVVVNPSLPVQTLREFVDYARANPGKIMFGHAGVGTTQQLTGELLKNLTGISIEGVFYRGSVPAMTGLIRGETMVGFHNVPLAAPQVQAGKIRALAVTADRRAPILPDVPDAAEAGIPELQVGLWVGLIGRKGIPSTAIQKLSAAVQEIVRSPTYQERMRKIGEEPIGSTPEQFAAHIHAELAKWKKIIQAAKIGKL